MKKVLKQDINFLSNMMWFVSNKKSSFSKDTDGVKTYSRIKGYRHMSSYKVPSYFDIKVLYCILHSFQNSTIQDTLNFSHIEILDFCYMSHTTHNKSKIEDSLKKWFCVSIEIDNFVDYVMGENRRYKKFNRRVVINKIISDYSIEGKIIKVKINPFFLRLIADSDSFALLDLDYCFLFKEALSFRLYEILSREMYKKDEYKVSLCELMHKIDLSSKSNKVAIGAIADALKYINNLNKKLLGTGITPHNLLYYYKCEHYSVVKEKHLIFKRIKMEEKKRSNIYRGDDDRTQDLIEWEEEEEEKERQKI